MNENWTNIYERKRTNQMWWPMMKNWMRNYRWVSRVKEVNWINRLRCIIRVLRTGIRPRCRRSDAIRLPPSKRFAVDFYRNSPINNAVQIKLRLWYNWPRPDTYEKIVRQPSKIVVRFVSWFISFPPDDSYLAISTSDGRQPPSVRYTSLKRSCPAGGKGLACPPYAGGSMQGSVSRYGWK